MSEQKTSMIEYEYDDFEFESLEDELLVDQRCQSLLNSFYQYLLGHDLSAQNASDLAYSADYYLRDYVLDFARQNIMRPVPGIIRKFAASWFITNTLDPEMKLLERHLEAVRALYGFLHEFHFISAEELAFLGSEADELEYYRQRIDSFLAITGDGYLAWEAQCPLRG